MDKKFLIDIIVGLCIFSQLSISLANVTDISETHQNLTEELQTEISTISLEETIPSESTTNATTEPSIVVTESSKGKKRLLNERPRRQDGFYPPRYGAATLFDMCPPLATTCPYCTYDGVQVPPGFCDLVVLKVLAISQPRIDSNGRVCGKFGILKAYGDVFREKEFRRLLRFSVSQTCGCAVKASDLYFLITPLSTFLKDGLLFNQVVLSEHAILISVDRYIEKEILDALNQCPVPYVPPSVSSPTPYVHPPVPSPPPYVHPPVPSPPPYVHPPVPAPPPYVHPPVPAPPPYVHPPVPSPPPYVNPPVPAPPPYVHPSPAPYVHPPVPSPPPYVLPPVPPHPPYMRPLVPSPVVQPPVHQPIEPSHQVRPVPAVSIPSLEIKQQHYRGKMPFLYPSLTKCLIPDTCPICTRLENAGDITGQYCVAGFAYLAVIRVPDSSTLQGVDSAYSGPTCKNLRTNIIYDITRTRDPQIMISALMALLPVRCLECFTGLSGPVIVMIMGQVPPVPPAVQLDASFQVYILPVPSSIVLPSCESYYIYGRPTVAYSLLPVAPQPYITNDCPEAGDQTCPLCQNYPETSFLHACASGFAIVAELNLAGPYFTSQRLPAISVKTTTTYYAKSVEAIISNPPPLECIKGFFKIIQNIGLAPLNFPGEIIPFVSLPNCECLSQGFQRLLIFSSTPLTISPEGFLHLSKDINIAFLQPEAAMPTCHIQPPPPPVYLPPQTVYNPPHQVPVSLYARPARVPLTYVPPPPPPPAYIPPSDPPPVSILHPDFIPPPVKEYSLLPSSLHVHPQPPPASAFLPEAQPPSYTTELPFEETPPPIMGCIEFGNGTCVIVDAKQNKDTLFSINVDEDIPYPTQFQALNSLIYEDSSVWSPSFDECLSSAHLSCPHSLEESPEKYEEFFCNAKTALIVAIGIDYSILGNETAATKRLTFIQPELPYIGINYDAPKNPVSLTVAVTRNKTMERQIQLQNNADYCYKEKVLVLADLSDVVKPKIVVGGLDVYIPGFCDSEIFDKAPSYGILLSLHQPSDVTNPVQLTDDFAFMPLPEGKLGLPNCGKSPVDEKPSTGVTVQSGKFWVPISPLESVICELSEEDTCGAWTTAQDEFHVLPCDGRSAVLVLIQNTSAGNTVGPNLEILEVSYESGEKVITLNVQTNIEDEDDFSYQQNQYTDDSNRCKYAAVKVLKDLSQKPLIREDEVFTIIGNINCDNPIFKMTNEVVLLLSDDPIYHNTVIPLGADRAEVIGIPPGTTKISFCNTNSPYDVSDDLVKVFNDSLFHEPFPDESVSDTSPTHEETSKKYEVQLNAGSYEGLETSCKGHIDDTCPVCEDIGSLSSKVYCNSGLSLFAEVIEKESGDGTCANGVIASLFDLTVHKGDIESKVMKISYTIPSHCSCPALKEGGHLVLLLDEYTAATNELSIRLSEGKYLYSTPLMTHFPTCYLEDSLRARSGYADNVIVLDSPYEELRKVVPELSNHVCPTIDHTCPICRSMDDKELKELYCSSEEVLLVSRNKTQKENPRKFTEIGKATFTKHKKDGNYSLEMRIDKHEGACALPVDVGNCNESLDRYYYDTDIEVCHNFIYTGCGGNANNFPSKADCENSCLVEDFCEEGILDIKKIMKSSDEASYLDQKFHYALPEHCICSEMFNGERKGYLLSTTSETLSSTSIQLSRNFHFVPLSKNQRKLQFACPKDDNAYDSSENNLNGDKDIKKGTPAKSPKKKGFGFFG